MSKGTVTHELDSVYLFKVQDYTTILLGRFDGQKFYVQRGDGEIYKYDEYRVEWRQKLKCSFDIDKKEDER